MKPGTQIYYVEDKFKEQNIMKCIVPLREEEVKICK